MANPTGPVDAVFVNPPSPDGDIYIRDVCRRSRKSRERMIWPQTCIAYPAAVVEKMGLTVDARDCIALEDTKSVFLKWLKEKKPKYYVSHLGEPTVRSDYAYFQEAKKMGCVTIAIGTHVTSVPKEVLDEYKEIDFVVRSEPEDSVEEIVAKIEAGKDDFENVDGIGFRNKEGESIVNKARAFQDLEKLPYPRHDLLPLDKYSMPIAGSRYTYLLVSRGCPWKCIYCVESVLWHGKIRTRSVESVIGELKWLQSLGVKNILFQADLFTVRKKWVMELCQRIQQEKLEIRWTCNSRVDTLNEEMIIEMKKAGCFLIAFGLESGAQEVLDRAKKDITVDQIRTTINLVHKHGIKSWGYFIVGLPGETPETLQETINLTKELPLDIVLWHTAAPYLGTEFHRQAKENGWLTSEDWEDFDMNESFIINYPQMSNKEIEAGMKRAVREWYMRPGPILKLIKSANNLTNIKSLVQSGLAHLSWMGKKSA